jgi:hypothetical protein
MMDELVTGVRADVEGCARTLSGGRWNIDLDRTTIAAAAAEALIVIAVANQRVLYGRLRFDE